MDAAPELSVITPTVGRPRAMRAKLASLREQTLEPRRFEWLVCLNGAPGASPALAATAELLAAADPPFALTALPSGRPLGPGGARNLLLARARGAALLFSDDDCVLPPDLLERHLAAQRRAPGLWLGGILFEADDRSALWAPPRRPGAWQLNGANSSAPRAAVAAAGGFPELPGYGGEDLLLGERLARAGLRARALPGAPVRHLGPDPRWGRDPAKARSAGGNAARVAAAEPRLAWRLGVHPLQRALKRALLAGPAGRLLDRALRALRAERTRAALGYERAYLEGAEAVRRDAPPETPLHVHDGAPASAPRESRPTPIPERGDR